MPIFPSLPTQGRLVGSDQAGAVRARRPATILYPLRDDAFRVNGRRLAQEEAGRLHGGDRPLRDGLAADYRVGPIASEREDLQVDPTRFNIGDDERESAVRARRRPIASRRRATTTNIDPAKAVAWMR
jgi:hypothetical protein